MAIDFLDELKWRGLLHQCTDEQALREHLADPAANPRKAYAGFDPTADSLTIGNLVAIMAMVHFARAGHTPIILMGGGTGLIGDPSGKSAERLLMTEDTVAAHVEAQRPIYENVFRGAAASGESAISTPQIVNNLDWLGGLGFIEVLRDIGKHFSVNMMIQKDSVRDRLHEREQGISYTEFSYMILQAYDFLYLFKSERVSIQLGGSDQWGNIVTGADLIRVDFFGSLIRSKRALDRLIVDSGVMEDESDIALAWRRLYESMVSDRPQNSGELTTRDWARLLTAEKSCDHLLSGAFREYIYRFAAYFDDHGHPIEPHTAFGLTAPLITKADGGKFGKTETGAIWLTANRTSPYAYHQFWLNAADGDVVRFLKIFTLLPKEEIDRLENESATNPGARQAQKNLAHHATSLLHGESEALACEAAAKALFSGQIGELPEATLRAVLAEVPTSDHPKANLADGVPILDLLIEIALASSKRQAREFLAAGSVSVNGRKIDGEKTLTDSDLLYDDLIAIRRGKKAWHLTCWS